MQVGRVGLEEQLDSRLTHSPVQLWPKQAAVTQITSSQWKAKLLKQSRNKKEDKETRK